MNEIKLHDLRHQHLEKRPIKTTQSLNLAHQNALDQRQRPLQELRISVTDRCNFRCVYCMPKEKFGSDYVFLPQKNLLSFEEITRLAKIFVGLGVHKIRITGGEPLLRKNCEDLIAMLAQLRTNAGAPIDLSLTTNGVLLNKKAQQLKQAGLQRITVSLDALDDAIFRQMNDVDVAVDTVLEGIKAAQDAGFASLKINMVVKAGLNDHQVLPMAHYFKNTPHVLRFIEYMDVGTTNGWKLDHVLPSEAILQQLKADGLELMKLEQHSRSETAQRWGYQDHAGEIGFISSVTQAFCSGCTRARLSTEGQLFSCLFAQSGFDLRYFLRDQQADDAEISQQILGFWQQRKDNYSEQRLNANLENSIEHTQNKKIEMSYIGG
jgi:cyclic pyranopterin phosphate synthase